MARDFLREKSVVRFVVVSSVGLSCRQSYSSSKKWHKVKLSLEARAREKDHRVAMNENDGALEKLFVAIQSARLQRCTLSATARARDLS